MYDDKGNFIKKDIENKIRNGSMTTKMISLMIVFSGVFAIFEMPR